MLRAEQPCIQDCPAYGHQHLDFKPFDSYQCARVANAVQCHFVTNRLEIAMKAIVDLFSTDYGLFSIFVILFTIAMGGWFYRFFMRKMDESERAQR